MAKWIFALLVFLSAGAQADGLAQNTSGCVVLNEIIYEEVTSFGWGITGADLVGTNFREPRAVICNGTGQAVSAAKSRTVPLNGNAATRQAGIGQRNGSGGDTGRVGGRAQYRP